MDRIKSLEKGEIMKSLLTLLLLSTVLHSAPILDQGFDTGVQGGVSVYENQWIGQSFNVGIEGTLQQIKLHLFTAGTAAPVDDLTAYITYANSFDYVAAAAVPLSTVPLSSPGIPGGEMVTVDFGANAPALELGSTWEIWLTSEEPDYRKAVNWTRDTSAPYSGGNAITWRQGRRYSRTVDRNFQTFMEPGTVGESSVSLGRVPGSIPEPSAFMFMCMIGVALRIIRGTKSLS